MGEPSSYFVQFPHPGREHVPAGEDMAWNAEAHGRKFLIAPGRYVDAAQRLSAAELVFWGEWEPPSHIERRWPASRRLPRALHRPYWTRPGTMRLANTDPWVWGEQMLYSNCRQSFQPHGGTRRRATAMQRLTPGSVICFGSRIDHEFCLDTAFVVASAERWVPARARALELSTAFLACTADPLAAGTSDADPELTLYKGASFDEPIDGMFSFVPAAQAAPEPARFARPPIRLPELINPANSRSPRGPNRILNPEQVRDAWQDLARQVFESGLVLGVSFATPIRRDGQGAPRASARRHC